MSYLEQKLIERIEQAELCNDYVSSGRMKEFLMRTFGQGIDFVRNGQEHQEFGPVIKSKFNPLC